MLCIKGRRETCTSLRQLYPASSVKAAIRYVKGECSVLFFVKTVVYYFKNYSITWNKYNCCCSEPSEVGLHLETFFIYIKQQQTNNNHVADVTYEWGPVASRHHVHGSAHVQST